MISVTGVVFSITIVALQLAAGQFSSRVMRDFLRDRITQNTFGVFVGTFTYSMVLQRAVVGISGEHTFVPRIAITIAFIFVLVSVGFFILYISHIANSIRVANIVDRIGRETRAVIEVRYPSDVSAAPELPSRASDRVIANRRAGVIVSVNEAALTAIAERENLVLVLLPGPGNFVPGGAPLVSQYFQGEPVEHCDDEILRHIVLDTERSYEQDVAFGFRELVDIAERALSPGINDPTTAAQCIDILHDLLRLLADRDTPSGRHTDESGTLRLVVPVQSFEDLLQLALEEIEYYGAEDIQVPRRLRVMLADLVTAARPEYQAMLQERLRMMTDQ